MRLIDKDELIKSLGIPEDMECCHCEWAYTYGGCIRVALSDVCFSIENAEEVGCWIPCSERLPKKHQMVLTTIKGVDLFRECVDKNFFEALATAKKRTWVSVGYFGDDGWYGADGFPQIVQPIAWMSMPEPYKEGEEDGNQTE